MMHIMAEYLFLKRSNVLGEHVFLVGNLGIRFPDSTGHSGVCAQLSDGHTVPFKF